MLISHCFVALLRLVLWPWKVSFQHIQVTPTSPHPFSDQSCAFTTPNCSSLVTPCLSPFSEEALRLCVRMSRTRRSERPLFSRPTLVPGRQGHWLLVIVPRTLACAFYVAYGRELTPDWLLLQMGQVTQQALMWD